MSRTQISRAILAAAIVLMTAGASVLTQSSLAGAASSVTGRAFQDFNMGGENSTVSALGQAVDVGIAGITVKAYSSTGTLLDTATTASDGTYSLSLAVAAGTQVRIEFTLPATGPLAAMYPSFAGADNDTTVQFVTSGATNVDAAFNVPGEFCQNSPHIGVVRLCHAGDTTALDGFVANSPSLFYANFDSSPYLSASPGDGDPFNDVANSRVDWDQVAKATESQTGSVLGLAYDNRPGVEVFYASAYVRRHTRMYQDGDGNPVPGAIFRMNPTATPATAFLVDLEELIAGDQFSSSTPDTFGFIQTNADRKIIDPDDILAGGVDARDSGNKGVFEEVGAAGIGDIDMGDDGNLYVVSLFTKHLYQVEMPADGSAPTTMNDLGDITAPVTCTNGDPRPFGLQPWRGLIYLGVVCDGSDDEGSGDPDLHITANIVTIDAGAATPTFATFITGIPLGAAGDVDTKGSPWSTTGQSARWMPWLDSYADANWNDPDAGNRSIRPVPMFSDIDFDSDGSIIMSFRDRSGDQMSPQSGKDDPDFTGSAQAFSGGDIRRLCRTGTGYLAADYTFEGGTGCATNGTNGTASTTDDEYYFVDKFGGYHRDTTSGFTEQVPGFRNVLVTQFDPWDANPYDDSTFASGGVKYMVNATGGQDADINAGGGVMYYSKTGSMSAGSFRKVNGMADIEAACDQAPVQIGNRVWIDTDKDGIQDPGEAPVAGVTVRLYAADGVTLLGTAVTNAQGEYYFSSTITEAAAGNADEAGGGLVPGQAAVIKLDNPADYAAGGPLEDYELTTATVGTKSTIDSNATMNTYPTMSVAAVNPGQNDHTYDVGFYLPDSTPPSGTTKKVSVGDYVWYDANGDGRQDASDIPIKGVKLTIKTADGKAVTDINGKLVGPTYTDANGKYTFINLPPGQYRVFITPPSGYLATESEIGARGGDSSTNSALSRKMTINGDRDPTLDFGFVKIGEFPNTGQSDRPWKSGLWLLGSGLVFLALARSRRVADSR